MPMCHPCRRVPHWCCRCLLLLARRWWPGTPSFPPRCSSPRPVASSRSPTRPATAFRRCTKCADMHEALLCGVRTFAADATMWHGCLIRCTRFALHHCTRRARYTESLQHQLNRQAARGVMSRCRCRRRAMRWWTAQSHRRVRQLHSAAAAATRTSGRRRLHSSWSPSTASLRYPQAVHARTTCCSCNSCYS